MSDFSVRSDNVDVEQIMRQIRSRIREKRGVDYTEEEIRELANVKLEKFIDPKGVRSGLLEQYRRVSTPEPPAPNFAFGEDTLYETHRGPIRWLRALFRPFLKLLFNPNPLIQALHIQADLNQRNAERAARREQLDALHYEVIHNLVVELTRTGVEVKSLKMRLESMASRLDFDERRARALEGVVQYRAGRRAAAAAAGGAGQGRPGQGDQRPQQGAARPQDRESARDQGRGEPAPQDRAAPGPVRRQGSAPASPGRVRAQSRPRTRRAPAATRSMRTATSAARAARRRGRRRPGDRPSRRRALEARATADAGARERGQTPADQAIDAFVRLRGPDRRGPSTGRSDAAGDGGPKDEAGGRRPALRRGHQWRRGAARPLHRRTPGAPRRRSKS